MNIEMRVSVVQSKLFSFPGSRLLRAYVSCVVAAGLMAIAFAAALGDGSGDIALIVGLILGGALSERFKVGLFGDSHVSVAAAVCMVAALAGGPRDAVIVSSFVAIAVNLGGSLPLYKTAFNVAVYVLASLAYAGTFELASFLTMSHGWPNMVLPATFAAAGYYALNVGFVAVAVSFASGQTVRGVMRENYLWLAPHYLPLGVLAGAAAAGYASLGVGMIPVFAIPIASIQLAIRQYSVARARDLDQLRDAEERIRAVEAELSRMMRIERASGTEPHAA